MLTRSLLLLQELSGVAISFFSYDTVYALVNFLASVAPVLAIGLIFDFGVTILAALRFIIKKAVL